MIAMVQFYSNNLQLLFDMLRLLMRYLGSICHANYSRYAANLNMKAISFLLLILYRVPQKNPKTIEITHC